MSILRRPMFYAAGVAVLATAVLFAAFSTATAGKARYYTGYFSGVAAGGYDPVSYFTAGMPVKGKKDITAKWDGVTWRFSSPENREVFLEMPKKYAPQFGGYCAYAVAIGTTAKGDPRNWKIVDGKLYLNYDRSIQRKWERQQSSYIRKGHKNWPRVLK
ncbi:MAG: YHS domain-containing (seleno)protein [Methyloligellaceae bacterium]